MDQESPQSGWTPRRWIDLMFVVFGAGLMVLAWPSFDLEFLAFFALAPVLSRLPDLSGRMAFVWSLSWCFLHNFGVLYWLLPVAGPGVPALALAFAFPPAVSLVIGRLMIWRLGAIGWLTFPVLWVAFEFPQVALPVTFPWFALGNSQYLNPMTQLASITGVYGVSFLLIGTNSCIAFWIRNAVWKKRVSEQSQRRPQLVSVAWCLFLVVVLVWGVFRKGIAPTGDTARIALLQGNYDHLDKWNKKNLSDILRSYSVLSAKAGRENADLVVWPETAIPQAINTDAGASDEFEIHLRKESRRNVEESVRLAGVHSLVGGLRAPPDPDTVGSYNAAFLFDPEGRLTEQEYYKRNRVPFGEFVPLEKVLFFVDIVSAGAAIFLKGERDTVFEVPWRDRAMKFGVLICYESLFPHLGREHVKNGADLLVVTSNDSWYGKSTMPHQIAAVAVIRAIESGVPMVRSANTGITMWCDARGNVCDVFRDESGESLFVEGLLVAEPHIENLDTWYVLLGDTFAWLCVCVSMASTVLLFVRKSQGNPPI